MPKLIALCVVVCAVLAAGFASAANPGQVPQNTLCKMGLADLQPMSDVQGTAVRGKYFSTSTSVSGWSIAADGASASGQKYSASGPTLSAGASLSLAGTGKVVVVQGNIVYASITGSFAGGGAIAVAK
jgi:hypothetical protein